MGDRMADLAAELVDEAMLRQRAVLGESPIAFTAEMAALRAAKAQIDAAVEAAVGRYRDAANHNPHLTH
jgi:hypothetical protein